MAAGIVAQGIKSQPIVPASHLDAGSSPSCSTSDIAPSSAPGKVVEDDPEFGPLPWSPRSMWETQVECMPLAQSSSGHCSHLFKTHTHRKNILINPFPSSFSHTSSHISKN